MLAITPLRLNAWAMDFVVAFSPFLLYLKNNVCIGQVIKIELGIFKKVVDFFILVLLLLRLALYSTTTLQKYEVCTQ